MVTKYFLITLCITTLSGCAFHDNCYRDFSGKINYTLTKKDISVIINKYYNEYSKWVQLDTLNINEEQDLYSAKWAVHLPQITCNNNCPNITMPDSIKIKILETANRHILKDTVFSCDDYILNGDDIELPTITLP